ncbi:hypothetical protein YC2023_103934 [Brassica napus]
MKLQRTVSSFTCATCNNTNAIGVLRLLKVYLLVSMEKCKSYITSELLKLHLLAGEGENPEHTATPFIAQMAGKTCTFHVRDGNDDHGGDMPGNISGPTKVDTDGDDCEEAPTIGTTSTGVTNKPPATATSKVAKKTRIA